MKKNIYKIGLFLLGLSIFSCNDFDEINQNPIAASAEQVEAEYLINSSIIGSQQDPHLAERIFVLLWKAAGRMDRINSLPVGVANDGWITDYYNMGLSKWLTDINAAISLIEEKKKSGRSEVYSENLLQIARIWRVYLLSEATDNFGPMPIDGFKGENPKFDSVENVYNFMLSELKDASQKIDLSVANVPESVKKHDPAYGYDFSKWRKYAGSLRMRLAMRLSEVAPNVAKTHFEEAVGLDYISENTDNFEVQEKDGWSELSGVMSREWNDQYMSPTFNNLVVGLGGIESSFLLSDPDALSKIKDNDWLGIKFDNHFATKTNNPVAGYWFDGIPKIIDPRAYNLYPIPGDFKNPEFNKYPSWNINSTTQTKRKLMQRDNTELLEIDAAFTWNAHCIGSWGEKGGLNQLISWPATSPRLKNSLRNSTTKRLFFGSWESLFLISEAAIRGWNVPLSAENAYNDAIKRNFDYWKIDNTHYSNYINSESYNRVGTSVKFTHTTEPTPITMRYKDGYTNIEQNVTYNYPVNHLYENGNIKNDALTKIITQKFIAQTPWLPLETWSDHRRLGLPFFENPAVENPLTSSKVNESNYMEVKREFFPQRLTYPSSLKSNVTTQYNNAINLLGGEDSVFTPLWWAKR